MRAIKSAAVLNAIIELLEKNGKIAAFYLYESLGADSQSFSSCLHLAFLTSSDTELDLEEESRLFNELKYTINENHRKLQSINLLKSPLTLQMRIVKEGKLIYSKDKTALADYKEQLIRRYCDLEPDLEKFYRDYDIGLRSEFIG